MALRYDAVAGPAFLHPFFFEKFLPFNLRLKDDLGIEVVIAMMKRFDGELIQKNGLSCLTNLASHAPGFLI